MCLTHPNAACDRALRHIQQAILPHALLTQSTNLFAAWRRSASGTVTRMSSSKRQEQKKCQRPDVTAPYACSWCPPVLKEESRVDSPEVIGQAKESKSE